MSILVIIAKTANLESYLTQFLSMNVKPGVINKQRTIVYLFKERLSRVLPHTLVDKSATEMFGQELATACPAQVSVNDFPELNRTQELLYHVL